MPHASARRIAALVAAVAFAALPAAAQKVYKWVDSSGRTQYGDQPPEGVKAVPVEAPLPPSDPSAARPDSAQRWKDAERAMRQERLDKEKREKTEAAQDERARGQRAARCREARATLDRVANVQRLYRYDAKGERVFLNDEERAVEERNAREQARQYCD